MGFHFFYTNSNTCCVHTWGVTGSDRTCEHWPAVVYCRTTIFAHWKRRWLHCFQITKMIWWHPGASWEQRASLALAASAWGNWSGCIHDQGAKGMVPPTSECIFSPWLNLRKQTPEYGNSVQLLEEGTAFAKWEAICCISVGMSLLLGRTFY